MQINEAKTKLIVATSADLPINYPNLRRRDVKIGERTFEVVPEFTYLGSKVSYQAVTRNRNSHVGAGPVTQSHEATDYRKPK